MMPQARMMSLSRYWKQLKIRLTPTVFSKQLLSKVQQGPHFGPTHRIADLFQRSDQFHLRTYEAGKPQWTAQSQPPTIHHDLLDAAVKAGHIEERIGYCFNNKLLCIEALKTTGPGCPLYYSGVEVNLPQNKRLALLGDRVLSLALCELWYLSGNMRSDYASMQLTVESQLALNRTGRAMGLHQHILVHHETYEGRSPISSRGVAESFEAIIGAVYVDAGHSMAPIKRIIRKLGLDKHRYLNTAVAQPGLPHELPYQPKQGTLPEARNLNGATVHEPSSAHGQRKKNDDTQSTTESTGGPVGSALAAAGSEDKDAEVTEEGSMAQSGLSLQDRKPLDRSPTTLSAKRPRQESISNVSVPEQPLDPGSKKAIPPSALSALNPEIQKTAKDMMIPESKGIEIDVESPSAPLQTNDFPTSCPVFPASEEDYGLDSLRRENLWRNCVMSAWRYEFRQKGMHAVLLPMYRIRLLLLVKERDIFEKHQARLAADKAEVEAQEVHHTSETEKGEAQDHALPRSTLSPPPAERTHGLKPTIRQKLWLHCFTYVSLLESPQKARQDVLLPLYRARLQMLAEENKMVRTYRMTLAKRGRKSVAQTVSGNRETEKSETQDRVQEIHDKPEAEKSETLDQAPDVQDKLETDVKSETKDPAQDKPKTEKSETQDRAQEVQNKPETETSETLDQAQNVQDKLETSRKIETLDQVHAAAVQEAAIGAAKSVTRSTSEGDGLSTFHDPNAGAMAAPLATSQLSRKKRRTAKSATKSTLEETKTKTPKDANANTNAAFHTPLESQMVSKEQVSSTIEPATINTVTSNLTTHISNPPTTTATATATAPLAEQKQEQEQEQEQEQDSGHNQRIVSYHLSSQDVTLHKHPPKQTQATPPPHTTRHTTRRSARRYNTTLDMHPDLITDPDLAMDPSLATTYSNLEKRMHLLQSRSSRPPWDRRQVMRRKRGRGTSWMIENGW